MSGLTFRDTKLAELTWDEVDENFRYLNEKANLYKVGEVYRGPVQKIYNGQLYILSSGVTFPFTTLDFATELAAGKWQLIGSGTSYKGELNLTTPVLANGIGVIGDYYKVVESGNYDFGAGLINLSVGDFVMYDGLVYDSYVDNNQLFSSSFLKKQFDYLQTYIGSGTDVVIPLNTEGRSHIQLKGTMTSIAGLSFADLVANPTNAEYPHYGKRFLFFNDSGHDIVLKHLVGTEDIFFTFKEETDLVFPNGEFLEFFNGSNVFVNVFRSWKDISNKLDKVSTVDVEKVYIKNADGTQGMKPVSELLSEILITNASVTGTYNIDLSAGDVWDLTLTGNTTLTESNAPASGFTKTITLEVSGNYTLTYPAGWTSKITGAYSGTATLNTITIQTFGSKRKVLIVQPT